MSNKNKKSLIQMVVLIIVGLLSTIGLISIGSSIVTNGAVMAVLAMIGFAILWMKLPLRLKKWFATGDLIFDVIFTVLIFGLFGLTVTGLIAAGLFCIFVSIILRGNKLWISYKKDEDKDTHTYTDRKDKK